MKNRLIEIIKVLKQVINETNLNCSDNTILEQASTYHRGELAQESRTMSNYQNNKIIKPQASNDEITPKQKAFLIKIKKYKEGMTKQDAFKVIQGLSKKEY